MNYRSKVILLAILLLIKACSGFFEWVHPEEWQQREPQVEEEKPSIGERLKEKAEETSQAVKEKAYEWKESIKETGKAIKEGIGQVGDEYGQEMSDTYHNIQKKTRQDIFQPMIRLMNHALGILEDDISPSSMERRFQKGWPSLFETNPRLWREYPDEYLLFIDVPGIPRQDLSVAISKSQVIVKGRHGSCIRPSKSKIGKEVDRLCLDRKIEEYLRIPEDVDQSKIECKFKEGVLIVRMPKIGEGDLQKSVRVDEYVPSWSEMAMEAKESVMGKFGWSHGTQDS